MLSILCLAVLCLVTPAFGQVTVSPEPSKACCPCKSAMYTPRSEPEREPKKEPKSEGEPPEAWYGLLGGLLGVFVIATVVLAFLLVKSKKQLKQTGSYPNGYTTNVQADPLPPKYGAK